MEHLTSTSFSSATALMGSMSIFSLISSLQAKTKKGKLSNSLAVLINTVAFIHYFRMREVWDINKKDIVFKVNAPNYTDLRVIEIISETHPEYDNVSLYYEDVISNDEE